jgi:GNAT superfamily N-acetyltransferase
VRIEPFDALTADDATAAAYCELLAGTRACVTPIGLRLPAEYVLNRLRNRSGDDVTKVWTAWDGSRLLGAVEVSWREAEDNRDRAWLHFDVPAGTDVLAALLDAVREECVPRGRVVMNVEVPPETFVREWVGALGAPVGSLEEHNVLRLRETSYDDVASLAKTVPDGYELLSFDVCPDDLVDPYVALMRSMNDAPLDDLTMEDWTYSEEHLRTWEQSLAARGHTQWTVVAREVATGELAAFNQLVLRPEWPECIENEDTAVTAAHRGHGLGLWVKAANLLRVLDERPEAVVVETWNAASNTHMLRVNRRLGFVCEHLIEDRELRLV